MINQHDKKQNHIYPVVAAVAGAVVGAGAVALKDKKNRKKVKKAFATVKGRAKDYIKDVQRIVNEEGEEIQEDFSDEEK